jgi:hypothetical protein
VKGDFANDDFMVRQKKELDVLFAGGGADDFGLVWDGYQVDSWLALGQGLQNAPTLFYSARIWKVIFFGTFKFISWYISQSSVSALTRWA